MKPIIALLFLLTFASAQTETTKPDALAQAKLDLLKAQEKLRQLEENSTTSQKTNSEKTTEKLSKIGIEVKDEVITIDTNKTKNFFDTFAKAIGKQLGKMTVELGEGITDSNKTGVDINDQHINIDMNKTQHFLENLDKKMQSFVKEFDKIAKEFNLKTK